MARSRPRRSPARGAGRATGTPAQGICGLPCQNDRQHQRVPPCAGTISDFALFAYGGAGPLHAAAVADELGCQRVLVPPLPGNFSAFGLLVADVRHDYARTRVPLLPRCRSPNSRPCWPSCVSRRKSSSRRASCPRRNAPGSAAGYALCRPGVRAVGADAAGGAVDGGYRPGILRRL